MPVITKPEQKKEKKDNPAKIYLQKVRYIEDDIRREEEEISELRQMAEGVRAIVYSNEKVQSSTRDHLGDTVVKIMTHIEKLQKDTVRMHELREKIRMQIADMPDPIHRQILFRHYLCGQRFETIASDLNYNYQYIINAHGRALQMFERMYLQ